MVAVHEQRVSTLAHRVGLRLIRPVAAADQSLYQLVEANTMAPIWPGGGAQLRELEDWLHFPWE